MDNEYLTVHVHTTIACLFSMYSFSFQPAVRRGRVSAVVRPTMEQLAKAREDMTHRLAQVKYDLIVVFPTVLDFFCL